MISINRWIATLHNGYIRVEGVNLGSVDEIVIVENVEKIWIDPAQGTNIAIDKDGVQYELVWAG